MATTTVVSLRAIIVSIAYATLQPPPRPSASSSITAFATQVALTITGIRSGYLVDTFILSFQSLSHFLQQLQRQLPSAELAVCWEEATEQVFFVNPSLLKSRISQNDLPMWISVTPLITTISGQALTSPIKIPEPQSFKHLLAQLGDVKPGSICRFRAERVLDLVPLAAFLLEYPVAYVVQTDASSFLSHVPLQIYDCTLNLGQEW